MQRRAWMFALQELFPEQSEEGPDFHVLARLVAFFPKRDPAIGIPNPVMLHHHIDYWLSSFLTSFTGTSAGFL